MNPPPPRRLLQSMSALATDITARLEESLSAGCDRLVAARESLQAALGREISAAECADMLSQGMVASFPLVAARREVFEVAGRWLLEQAKPCESLVLEAVFEAAGVRARVKTGGWLLAEDFERALGTDDSKLNTPHLFEHFLAEHRRQHRKRGGVFYTPQELVQFICRRVHQQLQEEFGLPLGLAEATILDPAAGTGAFPLGAIDVIHSSFPRTGDWNEYVANQLLPCLHGIEIIPAACLAAQLNIAVKLADTGFDFQRPGRIRMELGNTLADRDSTTSTNLQSEICNLKSPLVLLGNPPFSSLSDNRGRWITDLVRGSQERPGYVVTADERLGEKKTWLHDDYVKFIRYAQWLIEEAGSGIVGFVTNHGYLDNVTFRLMRRELLRVFDRIDVVDLHGNRKKGETERGREEFSRPALQPLKGVRPRKPFPTPLGKPDENVFGLDQGTAIGFFRRLPGKAERGREEFSRPAVQPLNGERPRKPFPTPSSASSVRHAELWGSREDKLRHLSAHQFAIPATIIAPASPNFLFTPAPPPTLPEYASAWRLPDAMPVNTTAPVTARDHFVVARTREELCHRIEEFRDLSIPDEEIRSRFFTRTRSAKYCPGDTRSWKLTAARRTIAAEDNWQSFIRRCLYRPYDWRFVFWHPAMIDWPRSGVVDRLPREQETGNRGQESVFGSDVPCPLSPVPSLLLLSRRQMLPTQPCSFFWMANTLPLDGVIRSDNRGSESLFPLYLADPASESDQCTANFAADFISAFVQRTELAWLPHGRGDLQINFGPEDLLDYIYALFHSPTYRERYAAELRTDFPRILLPRSKDLFFGLVPRGERLAQWHTLRAPAPAMNGVTEHQLQQFRAGGHQLLRASRKNSVAPLDHPLAPFVAATLHEMAAIDEAIQRAGGFPAAFTA